MAETILGTGIWYFNDPSSGRPIALGKVYIGQPDLDPKILANRVNVTIIEEDGSRVVIQPAQQPLLLGAGGNVVTNSSAAVVVKVSDTVSVHVDDAQDNQKNYIPFYNESTTADVNEGVAPVNGSFENETAIAGQADNWLIAETNTGTIEVDSSDSAHGFKSLKFTSIDGSGAGTITSDAFNVLENGVSYVKFTYKSTAVDVRNIAQIEWLNSSLSTISITTLMDEQAANPLVFSDYIMRSVVPATAVQARIILSGVASGGTTTSGSTSFDDVKYIPKSNETTNTITGSDVSSISVSGFIYPINKELLVDINTLNDAVGTAGNHEIVINGDTTSANYHTVNSIGGASANNNQLSSISGVADTENNTTLNISPNSTSGKTYIDITNVSFTGVGTAITKSSMVYLSGGEITSIEFRTASGNLAFMAGSRMTVKIK